MIHVQSSIVMNRGDFQNRKQRVVLVYTLGNLEANRADKLIREGQKSHIHLTYGRSIPYFLLLWSLSWPEVHTDLVQLVENR